jgi:hypothetical protein
VPIDQEPPCCATPPMGIMTKSRYYSEEAELCVRYAHKCWTGAVRTS